MPNPDEQERLDALHRKERAFGRPRRRRNINLQPSGDPEADLTQLVTLVEHAMKKDSWIWKGPSPWTEVAEFVTNLRASWETGRTPVPLGLGECQELVTAIEAVVENEDWLATMVDPPDDGDADQYRRAVVDILARNADGRS